MGSSTAGNDTYLQSTNQSLNWTIYGYDITAAESHFGVKQDGTLLISNEDIAGTTSNPTITLAANGRITQGNTTAAANSSLGGTILYEGSGGIRSFRTHDNSSATAEQLGLYNNGAGVFVVNTDGTTQIGGTLPSSPNIELNENGNATFAGGLSSGTTTNQGYLQTAGDGGTYGYIFANNSAGNGSAALNFKDDAAALRAFIAKDSSGSTLADIDWTGAATFAGNVQSGGLPYSGGATGAIVEASGRFMASRPSGNDVFQAHITGGAKTIAMTSDGSAYFGGTVPASPNISLNADGTSSFSEEVSIGVRDSQGVFITDAAAVEAWDSGSRIWQFDAGSLYIGGNLQVNPRQQNILLSSDGSAKFGPDGDQKVNCGGVSRATSNVDCGVGFANFGSSGGKSAFPIDSANQVNDNVVALGGPSARWTTVYAVTGSINTSDRNLKENIESLSSEELRVASSISKIVKRYQLKDSVKEKGSESARYHVGVIAQEVEDAFTAEGLEARSYSLFCEDTLEDGSKRLGIRYEELNAFLSVALATRIEELEASNAALAARLDAAGV